ncbi:MAG: NAD(P)-dependent oxidoreductase [Anaerolineae bacterium]|nr:NAD(P)-dependent oxidoreductase [Anaerolineae bacterium]
MEQMHVLVTGGAGYIGSMLAGKLLRMGWRVTVLDDLLWGGESLLPYFADPNFRFAKVNVTEPDEARPYFKDVDAVAHLAAIVGFPACQQVGEQVARLYNVEATRYMYDIADSVGARRFVFASTYSNYGIAKDGAPVDEMSPLNPQSLYAETKIESEQFLLEQGIDAPCAPVILRFATLFGVSPRTRFDLIVNQFVLEAMSKGELIIYQRGYHRSFIHVRDTVEGIALALQAERADVAGEIFNLGSEKGNRSKDEIVEIVSQVVPSVSVRYKDLSFGGDMRDIRVSFEKVRRVLGFEPAVTVEDGVREVYNVVRQGVIQDPWSPKYRNATFIVQ